MKIKILSCVGFYVFLLFSCSKSSDQITHINCDNLITDTLGTNDNAEVRLPNSFSPNADGLNDIAIPRIHNIQSLTYTIYDENNTVILNTTIGNGWNGSNASGTSIKYYYRIQAVTNSNHHIGICGELYRLTCYPSGIPVSTFQFDDPNEVLANCP